MWTYLELGSLQVIKFRWGHRVGPNAVWLCPYAKVNFGHRPAHKENKLRNRQELGEWPGTEPGSADTLILASGLQNCESICFCCLSHSVCGTLWQQPQEAKTERNPCVSAGWLSERVNREANLDHRSEALTPNAGRAFTERKFLCLTHSEAKQTEVWSLEQRKVYCRTMQGERGAYPPPNP